jgi:hypothetical protein
MFSTPSCASVSSSKRASRSGPISETVVRTGWPSLAEEVPERDGEGAVGIVTEPDRRGAFGEGAVQLEVFTPAGREARKVALHVRQDDRHAGHRKAFGQDLQGHGLAGAGGARDQAVAVGVFQEELLRCGVISRRRRR